MQVGHLLEARMRNNVPVGPLRTMAPGSTPYESPTRGVSNEASKDVGQEVCKRVGKNAGKKVGREMSKEVG